MNCPQCAYNLAGLPEEHVCPECGFEYDRHATIINFQQKKHLYIALIVGMANGLLAVFWINRGDFLSRGAGYVVGTLIVLFTLCFHSWRIKKVTDKPARCVLTKRSVKIEHYKFGEKIIDWKDIECASYSWINGKFRIKSNYGVDLFDRWYGSLGSPSRVRKCAKEINRLLKIYK